MARYSWKFLLLALSQITQPASGLVNLPVTARHDAETLKRSNSGPKIQKLIHDQYDVSQQSYLVEIKAGNPPQKMFLGLMSASSKTSEDFHLNKSNTISTLKGHDSAKYGDPTTFPPSNITFDLDIYNDRFEIANVKITKQTFGLLTPGPGKADNGIGLLGLGPNLELGYEAGKPYNTVLDSLAAQGAIPSRTYSLDLRGPGAITFGGADTGRFEGELIKRPMVKDELGTFGPSIVLSSFGQTAPNGTTYRYDVPNGDEVFMLDTGNQYFRLRHSSADPLFRDLGAVNDGNDAYFVPCSKREEPGTWDFQFGGVTIKVPYKNFITELSNDGKNCFVGVLTTWNGQLVLGQSFLQAAYLSFDFDNRLVGIAPSADCRSALVAFESGPHAIPQLTGCKAK
ncbi:putative aspartic-type endopeptidase OPSB 4 [Colletotrichum chlorophyti]|uniref:Putative aspartic-type endopeptidase OPSB 4 n=1 Tax=Colletotrichum chlorophyti TaxID=708187 RepID=A0A1Q8S8W7_9PEZI|nr:putative aspartic-type endopeptidase OPSB 4 [Colletotrichum chlorophyti]